MLISNNSKKLSEFLNMVIENVNEERKVANVIENSVESVSSSFQSILLEAEELRKLSENLKMQADGMLMIVGDFKL